MRVNTKNTLNQLPIGKYNVKARFILEEGFNEKGNYCTVYMLGLENSDGKRFRAKYTSDDEKSYPKYVEVFDTLDGALAEVRFYYTHVISISENPISSSDIIPIDFDKNISLNICEDKSGRIYSQIDYLRFRSLEEAKNYASKHNKECIEKASKLLQKSLNAINSFNEKAL